MPVARSNAKHARPVPFLRPGDDIIVVSSDDEADIPVRVPAQRLHRKSPTKLPADAQDVLEISSEDTSVHSNNSRVKILEQKLNRMRQVRAQLTDKLETLELAI